MSNAATNYYHRGGGHWVACVFMAACLLGGCGKSSQPSENPEDQEIRLEGHIGKLLGEINVRNREVSAMASSGNRGITPELREKARTVRHQSYMEEEFVQTLQAAREMVENKISGLAAEAAELQNVKTPENSNTNLMAPLPQTTNSAPDERMWESNLKTRLVEVRAQTDELLIMAPSMSKISAEERQKAEVTREEYYSSEKYLSVLRATRLLLEKKLAGLEAEAAFYESLGTTNTNPRTNFQK